MIAGVMLKDTVEEDCQIAFLDDELEIVTANTNPEIAEVIAEREPDTIAFNVGTEFTREEFTEKEEELKEEGHVFTPTSHEKKRAKRLKALKSRLFQEMGTDEPEVIRFDPQITARELAIQDDSGLESYGIDPSNVRSAEQFDALLGAVTARFYGQNQYRDLGVIVPEPMREE